MYNYICIYIYIYVYIYIDIYHIYNIQIYIIYIYIYQFCVSIFENLKSQFIQKYILFKRSNISVCSKTFREMYREKKVYYMIYMFT